MSYRGSKSGGNLARHITSARDKAHAAAASQIRGSSNPQAKRHEGPPAYHTAFFPPRKEKLSETCIDGVNAAFALTVASSALPLSFGDDPHFRVFGQLLSGGEYRNAPTPQFLKKMQLGAFALCQLAIQSDLNKLKMDIGNNFVSIQFDMWTSPGAGNLVVIELDLIGAS